MDDDDVDAALDAFFGEDALLEALQDAPGMEEQADAFRVPGAPARSASARTQPFAHHGEEEEDIETQSPNDTTSFAVERQGHRKGSKDRTRSGSNGASTHDARASNPGAARSRLAAKGKGTRTWRGTMVVILTSLVIWACILMVWGGPGEVGTTPLSPGDGSLAAPTGPRKETASLKDIQLPGWAAAGTDEGSGTPAPRGRVDVSLSSASAVGNTSGEVMDGNNTNASAVAKTHQRSRRGSQQRGIGAGH